MAGIVFAQPECRSVLGAHLTPVDHDSMFSWAGELVEVPAYMEDRLATNSMLFLGADFTSPSKKHNVYVEGGVKVSLISSSSAEPVELNKKGQVKGATQILFGAREAFYQFSGSKNSIRLGLSTTQIGDYFLVNERVIGASYVQTLGSVKIDVTAGTVGPPARMTDFCGTKRLTSLVNKEKYGSAVSDVMGETNLAAAVVRWDIKQLFAIKPVSMGDEFQASDEFSPIETKPNLAINHVGLLYYQEYDTRDTTQNSFFGGLMQTDLPFSMTLKNEGVYQMAQGNAAIIHYGTLTKDFYWNNASNTSMQVGYYGKYDIDKNAAFLASFSNLFKGEIMRLDAIDVPIVFSSVRHNFAGTRKFYAQLQGVRQLYAEQINEADLELGADFFKHLRVVGIGSYITSFAVPEGGTAPTEKEDYVGKLELRLGF
jgi:hypothetical protein